jgi:iron(III) transport system substrate-binding protein
MLFLHGRRGRLTALLSLVVLLASVAVATATAGPVSSSARPIVKPYTKAQWQTIVARAKQEGTVVFYSGQTTLALTRLADAFKKKYGITVVWNRVIDNVSRAQVNAEISTGRAIADVWELSSKAITTGALRNEWAVDARGPELFTAKFNRDRFTYGKATIIGVGLLGMAFNSKLVPGGVRDITDFLNPTFANGRMGLPDPSVSPSIIDYYKWLEQNYGSNILQRLAAQKPRIYLGVQPLQQAIIAGEIAGAPYSSGAVLADKDNGAPIDFRISPKGAWNVPFYTLILKQAPHPNAAQLLLNYLISREGQAVASYRAGAIYQGIPDTFFTVPRSQTLNDFTPAKIAAFQSRFNGLFRG